MRPSGTGKTFIASGLIHDAVLTQGTKPTLRPLKNTTILQIKEMKVAAMNAYKRLLKANVTAIDNIKLLI